MTDPAITTTTTPAAEPQANAPAVQSAPAVTTAQADDPVTVASLLKHNGALVADLAKLRAKEKERDEATAAQRAEAEKKMREAGDLAGLLAAEREKKAALEAQLATLTPQAERFTAHEQRVKAKLEARKAKGDLPAYVTAAIDIAVRGGDVDAAFEFLLEFEKASAPVAQGASRTPASPAPNTGGAAATSPPGKKPSEMSPAELETLKATDPNAYYAHIGGAPPGKTNGSVLDWFSRRPG